MKMEMNDNMLYFYIWLIGGSVLITVILTMYASGVSEDSTSIRKVISENSKIKYLATRGYIQKVTTDSKGTKISTWVFEPEAAKLLASDLNKGEPLETDSTSHETENVSE